MSKKRRNHSAEFKAKAATAIKGGKTLSELAHPFEVYPNQITQWKQQLLEYVSDHNMDPSDWTVQSKGSTSNVRIQSNKIKCPILVNSC